MWKAKWVKVYMYIRIYVYMKNCVRVCVVGLRGIQPFFPARQPFTPHAKVYTKET